VRQRQALEELARRLSSELKPQPPEIAYARHGNTRVAYVRVPVSNGGEGVANRCSARLLNVKLTDARGTRDLEYRDTLEFGWSNKIPGTREIDIRPGLTEWFDVVLTQIDERRLSLATIIRPNTYDNLMIVPGTYQFDIELSSEGRGAVFFQVAVNYGLNIDSLVVPDNPLTRSGPRGL
jgi:hypothetical protein